MTENKIIKGVVINDLHFGIDASERLYNELHQFNDYLKEHKGIQLLVIDGDYFDHRLYLTSSAAFYAFTFFQELITICKEQSIIVRMVQGTAGHELNQLQSFNSREFEPGLNFRIIRNVQEEDLLGLHILYLPEEYPLDANEYYKEFKAEDKRYNMIFGHGTWDFVSFQNQIEHGNQTATQSAPVFMWNEWKHTVPNGFISFGHIHGRNVYGKKIFYSGSFTRWGYGERSARGFTAFEYNLENQMYDVKFIDNIEAPIYDAIKIKSIEGIDLVNQDIKTIQAAIDNELTKADFMEVDLSGLSKENINLLTKVYSQNPNVKIVVKEVGVSLKESVDPEEAEREKRFRYITKRELPLDKTIQKYSKEELDTDLDLETINNIIKES